MICQSTPIRVPTLLGNLFQNYTYTRLEETAEYTSVLWEFITANPPRTLLIVID